MPAWLPSSLSENHELAFVGETPWPPAQTTPAEARTLLAARNPTGRPNADVVRHLVGCQNERRHESIQIDFPHYFSAQEAALYVQPFARLTQSRISAWQNPNANSGMRTALAKRERYLATPFNSDVPTWDWIESHFLPDDTLLAVARDDDFTHGVLQSHAFLIWWRRWLPAISTTEIVRSFPFPWPPATTLSALTRAQEEHRLAIARAVRSGAQASLDAAVVAAYGWPNDLSDDATLAELAALHRQRA
ncbi:MAG: hypothetical protein ABI273_21665 [Lacunisphaera sp.]